MLKKPEPFENERTRVLASVSTPLGFFVLTLLIIETTLGLVISLADFSQPYKWVGFICMIAIFALVVGYVGFLTAKDPTKLLFGKEEHALPQADHSALLDGAVDLLLSRVKPECLKDINPKAP